VTPDQVRELSGAVSTQASVANRFWFALIIATLLVLIPHPSQTSVRPTVDLPFQLGTVRADVFYQIAFPMLAVLLIAFCTAHVQVLRATTLAHRILDKMASSLSSPLDAHPRELFDMYRLPSLSRVAPLAQVARWKYQYYPEASSCPRWLKRLTAAYYLILKLAAILVYLVLPGWAFWRTGELALSAGWAWWGVVAIGGPAALAFSQTIIIEMAYVYRVVKLIGGE
jgi:hypothetical protein